MTETDGVIEMAGETGKGIHLSAFQIKPTGHGGNYRSFQISNLPRVEFCDSLHIDPRAIFASHRFKFFCHLLRNFFRLFSIHPKVSLKFELAKFIVRELKLAGYTKFYVEQASNFSMFIAYELSQQASLTELFPHNVEFLVGDQVFSDESIIFPMLINTIKMADKVSCISEFDTSILRVLNNSVETVRYELPDQVIKQRDIAIAEAKVGSFDIIRKLELVDVKFGFSFGSMMNPPTLSGMESLAKLFHQGKFGDLDALVVAGRGSEKLKIAVDDPNIRILDFVSDRELFELMEKAHAILIYQRPTSGWLTKLNYIESYLGKTFLNDSYSQGREIAGSDIKYYSDRALKC